MRTELWEWYKTFAAYSLLGLALLILIFGGSVSVKINFDSWGELWRALNI